MDPETLLPSLLLIAVLLATCAFFVAAEFTLIAVRRGRLEQIARDGEPRALGALSALKQAEELALAAQFGSSASSLLLGYVAADLGLRVITPYMPDLGVAEVLEWRWVVAPMAAVVLAILLIAALHVILSEQVPKILGIQRAEWMATRVVLKPLKWFAILISPLVWLLSRIVGLLTRTMGLSPAGYHPLVHTPEEIRLLVAQSHEQGVVEADEREMIHGIFEFSETVAREVMTPRTDVVAVPVDIDLDELIRVVAAEGHSRLPVYQDSIDTIVGVLLVKDLLPVIWQRNGAGGAEVPFDIRSLMREPYFVPDTKPVDDLLSEFRQQSVHIAIVLDEFGGTYGLVTMEDLLEEIVGDINDEYDIAEEEFSSTPEGDILIDGGASISGVNERFGLALSETDFDTIGGYILGSLGRVPEVGDVVEVPGAETEALLRVEETEERRVTCVRLVRSTPVPGPAGEEG